MSGVAPKLGQYGTHRKKLEDPDQWLAKALDRAEQIWLNSDGDNDYEAVIYDSNEDGRAEWIRVDTDNNGYFDTWYRAGATSSGPTVYDQWAQNFIQASNNRLVSIWLS